MQPKDDQPAEQASRPISHTEADETSQTRFGPRPVPPGHRRPQEPPEPRRSPPHGAVSPDGRRAWPQPSRGAKWLVWGGAALTAGTVIATRQVISMLSDDKPQPRPDRPRDSIAPRFADLGAEEREAMRRRARQQDAAEADHAERLRAEAKKHKRRRKPRQTLVQEIETNTASLNHGVENLMQSLGAAVTGFRTVAGQAGAIMREFGDAADIVQNLLGHGDRKPQPRRPRHDPPRADDRHGAHMPDLRDDPLLHDPLQGPDPESPADHDPRVHRL